MHRLSYFLTVSGLFVGPVVIGLSGFFALCFITGLEYANAIELLVTLVIGCEIAWYFYYRHRVLALSEKETIPAPFPEEHDDMFHKIVDFIVQHGNVFFPIWFKDRNVENITKSEFRAMFAANYHHKASAEMTEAQHEQFNSLLSIIVEKTGARFMAEDENSGRVHYDDTEPHPVGYMQHTRDSLQVIHHPLCLYLWSHASGASASFVLRSLGFQREWDGSTNIPYWHRPSQSESKRKPIVFAHGMGVGLSAYLHLIWSLCNLSTYVGNEGEHKGVDEREVYLMDFPHISMRICEDVPTVDNIIQTVVNFLDIAEYDSAVFVGHSYGSVILARMAKTHRSRMHTSVFVDPICFLLFLPKVLHSFIYRYPDFHLLQWIRYYLCSRELYMQNVLCRNFWWYQYILFASEVPKNAIVVASLNDDIVPSQTVVDYLNEHSPDTHIIKPQYFHAEFLAHPHFIGELMSEVVKMENKASDTVIQRAVRGA